MRITPNLPIVEQAVSKKNISRSSDDIDVVLEDFEGFQKYILASEISLVFRHFGGIYDDRVTQGRAEASNNREEKP